MQKNILSLEPAALAWKERNEEISHLVRHYTPLNRKIIKQTTPIEQVSAYLYLIDKDEFAKMLHDSQIASLRERHEAHADLVLENLVSQLGGGLSKLMQDKEFASLITKLQSKKIAPKSSEAMELLVGYLTIQQQKLTNTHSARFLSFFRPKPLLLKKIESMLKNTVSIIPTAKRNDCVKKYNSFMAEESSSTKVNTKANTNALNAAA